MHDVTLRKILSGLSHGAIFFSATIVSVGIPIAVMALSEDPVVKENAVEAINFHLNIWVALIVFYLLSFLCIGIPLLIAAGILSIVLPLVAIVGCLKNPNSAYKYPGIVRIF